MKWANAVGKMVPEDFLNANFQFVKNKTKPVLQAQSKSAIKQCMTVFISGNK